MLPDGGLRSMRFYRTLERLTRGARDRDPDQDPEAYEAYLRAIAEVSVIGWSGDLFPAEYSPAECHSFMVELPDFARDIYNFAQDLAIAYDHNLEQDTSVLRDALEYELSHGKVEQTILDQCARQNLPIPERIKNKPRVPIELKFYFKAFFDLLTHSGGGGNIPWKSAKDYAEYYELSEIELERMWQIVSALETQYIKFHERSKPKGSERTRKT